MLSEEDKQRIRHEEIFRQEVREQILRPTLWHHTWEILNGSFCLWAMSTIVLGLATWAYSRLSEMAETRREIVRALSHLDIELKFRLIQLRDRLRTLDPVIEKAVESHAKATDTALAREINEMFAELEHPNATAFPEFKDRGLFSLLIQLAQLELDHGDGTARVGGRSELVALRRLHMIGESIEANPTPAHIKSGVDRILEELTRGALRRWANPPDLPDVSDPESESHDQGQTE